MWPQVISWYSSEQEEKTNKQKNNTKNKPPPQNQTKPTTTKHTKYPPCKPQNKKPLTPTKRPNTLMNYTDSKDA